MSTAEIPDSPRILAQDLQDPKLERFNRVLSRLFREIAAIQGVTGPISFKNTVTGPHFIAQNTGVPTDDAELLSLGAARMLFNPNAIRDALISKQWFGTPVQPLPVTTVSDVVRYGTHANRPLAGTVSSGTLYVETDRDVVYQNQIVANVFTWVWIAGEMRATQATLPADLGVNDTGFIVQVADYNHKLQWSGTAWGWASGDNQSAYIHGFLVDPSPTTGWKLCDGSLGVSFLKSDGTLGTQNLPDLVSASNKAAYLKLGSPASATVNVAVAPLLTMNSYTPAGTVTAPVFTGNALTSSGTNSAPAFTGNSATPTGTISAIAATGTTAVLVTTSGAVQVAAQAHTHAAPTFTGNAATPTGSVSAPTFTGNAVTPTGTNSAPAFTGTPAVLTGTIDTTGQPQNVVLRPWFRL